MALNTLAIDIGKQSFHVFGIDDDGVIVSRKVSRSDPRAGWMKGVAARRGFNRAVIAGANKMARAAWAMLVREEAYAPA